MSRIQTLPADQQQLLDRISATIDARLAPVREAQTNLQGQLDQMSQPVTNGQSLVNRAPGQIKGPLPSKAEKGGYQLRRVVALQSGARSISAEECKYELDVSRRLEEYFVRQNGFKPSENDSILVPLGSAMLDDCIDLRDELRQSLADGVAGADREQLQWAMQRITNPQVRQALSMFDDSALGVFAHGGPAGEMIELLRNREVFSRAGASQVTLPPNGRLPFPKQTGATTAYWVGENSEITDSEPMTGSIELVAKKLAVLTKLPNELVRFGNPSTEAFIRNDMAKVMALKADLSMLEGIGSTNSVKGLINYTGVQPYTASTAATDGNTFEPKDIMKILSLLEEANHDSSMATWVMRFKMWGNIMDRRAAAHTAGTYDGAWLFPTNRSDVKSSMPTMLSGGPVVTSNQVSNTRDKGSSTDLTYILCGLFEHFLIGRVGVLELASTTSGDTPFTKDQTWLRAIQHLDAAPRYENAFVMVDDIDMDLPA